jgi:hypothetical protein
VSDASNNRDDEGSGRDEGEDVEERKRCQIRQGSKNPLQMRIGARRKEPLDGLGADRRKPGNDGGGDDSRLEPHGHGNNLAPTGERPEGRV